MNTTEDKAEAMAAADLVKRCWDVLRKITQYRSLDTRGWEWRMHYEHRSLIFRQRWDDGNFRPINIDPDGHLTLFDIRVVPTNEHRLELVIPA